MTRLRLDDDRLFPVDRKTRAIARNLFAGIADLPIISPHGHTDAAWFARNTAFPDPYTLLVAPDHYVIRMLYSQGITLAELGFASNDSTAVSDSRTAWRTFAQNYHLFIGTPVRSWLDHVFYEVFGIEHRLEESMADFYFDAISDALERDDFRPRALYERFNIEFLATTESPTDSLANHEQIRDSDWEGRVVTAYRPDPVVDPEHADFQKYLEKFAEVTGEDAYSWTGYLNAHRKRRQDFIDVGATSTDHGHPSAATADLSSEDASKLFGRVLQDQVSASDAELFRAQMLTEMARMSLDDHLVLQIHPGSSRNHNHWLYRNYGPDLGADIPRRIDYTQALKPFLNRFGNERDLTVILFTLDESNYSRELAPLAAHYPCLRLGPAWWFHDSPDGLMRYRRQTTETAGFYNTVGFNDDTRAFLSIPARHDVARRVDCAYLAQLVSEHRLNIDDAQRISADLAYHLPKQAYRIDAVS